MKAVLTAIPQVGFVGCIALAIYTHNFGWGTNKITPLPLLGPGIDFVEQKKDVQVILDTPYNYEHPLLNFPQNEETFEKIISTTKNDKFRAIQEKCFKDYGQSSKLSYNDNFVEEQKIYISNLNQYEVGAKLLSGKKISPDDMPHRQIKEVYTNKKGEFKYKV